ncbi:hypothetical protein SAMN04489712_1359 [Thermomonospora echinospora]|uniref:Uncharacterized protein n=1 Tax=Thermomonospora echinospora TaxID=1992 RepID=A0A1H6E708_9ACTN|nr:hypothetical protein SAMN04489712_1359 [Thermomonospora echinospora]
MTPFCEVADVRVSRKPWLGCRFDLRGEDGRMAAQWTRNLVLLGFWA